MRIPLLFLMEIRVRFHLFGLSNTISIIYTYSFY